MNYLLRLGFLSLTTLSSVNYLTAQNVDSSRAPAVSTLTPTKEALDKRMRWFNDARYGMFIHWGVYSTLSGTWHGVHYQGYGEHIQRMAKIPIPIYRDSVAGVFNPVEFNADEWVKMAKATGMKYMIITAKHHDGFAMYDSKVSDYNILKATPFGRDPMKELKAACTKAGIKFGFYYSHAFDWGEKNGVGNDWEFDNPGGDKLLGGGNWWEKRKEFIPIAQKYVDEKSIPQILELINNYHPDIMWFDTPHKLPDEENLRILAAIRKVAPDMIVNGRESHPLGNYDYGSTSDGPFEFKEMQGYWEGIPTTNNSYGYNANDNNYKPVSYFIQLIAKASAPGGNILMNIGPMGNGKFNVNDVNILNGISKWWKVNGESSIRGTSRTFLSVQAWGESTIKRDTIFLHVFQWPKDGKLILGGIKTTIKNCFLLSQRNLKLKSQQIEGDLVINVPKACPDTIDEVVAVVFKGVLAYDKTRLLQPQLGEQKLRTFDASLRGSLKYAGESSAYIEGMKKLTDSIVWHVKQNEGAEYEVIANYWAASKQKINKLVEGDAGKELSKANAGAGGVYVIDINGTKLTHTVTNGKNITETLGKITVPKGVFNINVFADSISGEELFRLKSIILKTVKK